MKNISWHWWQQKQQKIQLSAKSLRLASSYLSELFCSCSQDQSALLHLIFWFGQYQEWHSQPDYVLFSQMLRLSLNRNWKILPLKETDAVNPIISYNHPLCKIAVPGNRRAWNSVGTSAWEMLPSSVPLMTLSLLVLDPILALLHSTTYLPLLSPASLSELAYTNLGFLFRRHEVFEVHYPYLFYSTFQLIQILALIAVFSINFLPLDSQSIPHY